VVLFKGAQPLDVGRYGMKDSELRTLLERAEVAYEHLLRARASLGTMLAEAIRRDRDLSEFNRHMEDLPLLIQAADIRRTELKVELLGRQLKEAQQEHRRASAEANRASTALQEARRAYTRAVNVDQRSSLKAQRLEELHREEQGRLEQLRSEVAVRKEEEEEVGTS
jgi:multidrug efflux pump subunit AcrA (membrane-fusion protein)